jgi:hypothetical protein
VGKKTNRNTAQRAALCGKLLLVFAVQREEKEDRGSCEDRKKRRG